MSIEENIRKLKEDIREAADWPDRPACTSRDITLIAVTKTHPPEKIDEAIEAGITDIGENKVQELIAKYDSVKGDVRWHMIGHLQTNKVRQIVDKVVMIHSVDSIRLAREIDKRSKNAGKIMDILIQVNAAGEDSKFGVSPEECLPLAETIAEECENVRVCGLMHMAPFADDPEDVRVYFTEVRKLFEELSKIEHERIRPEVLSMGMSGDYAVAVQEGSNAVRIGSAVFGDRKYT